MNRKLILVAIASIMLAACSKEAATNKGISKIGISLGSMGNPYFIALAKGATDEAKKINPNVEVNALGYDYDLNKQFTQIDNFVSAGVDLILLNPADASAIAPAIKRAQAAGVKVVAVDSKADGADGTVMTDNVAAGKIACDFIVRKLGGKGNVIIQNGPQVSSVVDRVQGCKSAFKAAPGINILSSDQDGKTSRDGGMNVMQAHLTRFPRIDAVFAINDEQAIGADLAAQQMNKGMIMFVSVDGSPAIEASLKDPGVPMLQASASQDPYAMGQLAVDMGKKILDGKAPDPSVQLMPPKLLTRDNVKDYHGWTTAR